jgi:cytochrome c peroxidase
MTRTRAAISAASLALVIATGFPAVPVGGAQAVSRALPKEVKAPADNPTDSPKVELGRMLFWDPILSGGKDVACATCHHPDFGYAEPLDLSVGVKGVGLGTTRKYPPAATIPFVKRNSQSLLNTAFNGIDAAGHYTPATAPMFWDLRVTSLEAQALEPIKSFEEMRGDAYGETDALDQVVARLARVSEYRGLFKNAFGGGEPVTAVNLGKALAAFQRSLLANNSPFDRYMRGDLTAMTASQIGGLEQFDRAGCTNCHSGPMFSDFEPHVLGVPDNAKLAQSDAGVGGGYAFRTPSLRNLRYSAPYMHNGAFTSLNDVLRFYNGAGRRARNPNVRGDQLDPALRRVNAGRGGFEIINFLDALNDDSFDKRIPSRVPSGLAPGGNIRDEKR